MRTLHETNQNVPANSPRREFCDPECFMDSWSCCCCYGRIAPGFLPETAGNLTDVMRKIHFRYLIVTCTVRPGMEKNGSGIKVTNSFEDFVSYLDKTGVQRGIINSQRSFGTKPEEFIAGNREVARYVEKYKGRFIGACVVNPLYIEESLREIEYCHNQLGFVWVGELCNYMVPYLYSIREFEMLVEQVVKLNMVLALHTEQGELEYLAQKFPEATIAFAHFGDDHEYEDIFRRIDTVAKNPNFYLDTSGYGHDRVGVLEYAVKTIGPDRILFGSDFSINDPGTVIARISNSFLTMEQKQKILSGNLLELLKKVQKV